MPTKAKVRPAPMAEAPRAMLANAITRPQKDLALPESGEASYHMNIGRKLLRGQGKKRYRWMTPSGAVKLPGLPYRNATNGHIPLPSR